MDRFYVNNENTVMFERADGRIYDTGFTHLGLEDAQFALEDTGTMYFKRII